ncbi:hypothetical protein [Plasmodium yoelii yoelii]|uniref:Uncharacterized protein n=1 Tax=Plasmodium yoelii yoelii TaxID=73239 RepID=Q7RAS2_PLAYO|nr:hypothetical protein [Plasmodium yoelii yoelii]
MDRHILYYLKMVGKKDKMDGKKRQNGWEKRQNGRKKRGKVVGKNEAGWWEKTRQVMLIGKNLFMLDYFCKIYIFYCFIIFQNFINYYVIYQVKFIQFFFFFFFTP